MVRRVVVILILTVSLKPDSTFVSGPCRLIKGMHTAESEGNRQVVFKVHGIEEKGEINCKEGYSMYSTNEMAEKVDASNGGVD